MASRALLQGLFLSSLVYLVACKDRVLRRDLEMQSGPSDVPIWTSGLLEEDVSAAALIQSGREYYENTDIKKFQGKTLAFVDKENPYGYAQAIDFRSKFSHVSPHWFSLKRSKLPEARKEYNGYYFDGDENVNEEWMADMRLPAEDGTIPKIVPRVKVDLDAFDTVDLLTNHKEACLVIFLNVVSQNFDGIVLDAYSNWIVMNNNKDSGQAASYFNATANFVAAFARLLHDPTPVLDKSSSHILKQQLNLRKEVILQIPPMVPQLDEYPRMHLETMKRLAEDGSVDGWSVLSYDFSHSAQAGPNAPMSWLKLNMDAVFNMEGGLSPSQAPKIWMGLNFYGFNYNVDERSSEPITVENFMQVLSKYQPPLTWDEQYLEHYIKYKEKDGSKHRIYFPTPRSVQVRLEEFDSNHFGVSIWSLGLGLERFYDLL